MKSLLLKVEGMRCDGCASTLQTLLGAEQGVLKASVSHGSGTARLLFDPNITSAERLIDVAGRPGFDVSEMAEA